MNKNHLAAKINIMSCEPNGINSPFGSMWQTVGHESEARLPITAKSTDFDSSPHQLISPPHPKLIQLTGGKSREVL